jgi:diguanylate cyclase (GGDEF)-like protein
VFDLERLTVAKLAPGIALSLAFSSLVIVGLLDYLTGYEISFAVFYLVPVSIAAWYVDRRWARLFAFASCLTWYFAELAAGYPYSNAAIPVWNAFVRFVFFQIVALLLPALRARLFAESRLAQTDPLTGLLNARAFLRRLEHDLALNARTSGSLTLAYVDVDNFKYVNDTYGHHEGDQLLRSIASRLEGAVRQADSVGRLGGDEFALILPTTDLNGARVIIGELAKSLASSVDEFSSVTCSIGAVVFQDSPDSGKAAIAAADQLMYDAKRGGKNALVLGVYAESALRIDQSQKLDAGSMPPRTGHS